MFHDYEPLAYAKRARYLVAPRTVLVSGNPHNH